MEHNYQNTFFPSLDNIYVNRFIHSYRKYVLLEAKFRRANSRSLVWRKKEKKNEERARTLVFKKPTNEVNEKEKTENKNMIKTERFQLKNIQRGPSTVRKQKH